MTEGQWDRSRYDAILVGGGLANQLIAWRLTDRRPDLRLAIVERGPELGGNHTWSFHATDISPAQSRWIEPLVTYSWDRQEVRFPGQPDRVLGTGYRSVLSDKLAAAVREHCANLAVLTNASAEDVRPDRVTLADGTVLSAPLVIDGRGALREQPLALAFQKFYGLEIETETPHGETHPVIMDATVAQADGYRFVYTLPMTANRILVEDTYYSEDPGFEADVLERRTRAYADLKGWRIAKVVRQEQGILPISLAGDIDRHWATLGRELPRAGLRAWLFHATTGYSVPYAARLADRIATARELTSASIAAVVEAESRAVWSEQAYMRLINRLLFVGAKPSERVAVMARFYRLGEPLIQRFYAGQLTLADKARILSGRPPIPISRGLRVIAPERAWDFVAGRPALTSDLG
jgi:lycopene beta-cyclase